MFLSIIIPIYNDEKYLEECLDSCLHQDIPSDDYEIICVDDGSTDRTPEILRDYADRYPNIVLIFNQHQGGSLGRNTGLEASRGDYVWFVDHDDFLEENILLGLKERILQTQCDRISFPCYIVHGHLSEEEQKRRKEGKLAPDRVTFRNSVWSSIIRRAFMLDHDIWPRTKKVPKGKAVWATDILLTCECRKADERLEKLEDRPYYFYRMNPNQETANNSEQSQRAMIHGIMNTIIAMKKDYDAERAEYGQARAISADTLMQWEHLGLMKLVSLPHTMFVEGLKEFKKESLFPMKNPPEYSFTLQDCINLHKQQGRSLLYSICFYYSSYPLGIYAYRATRIKSILSRLKKRILHK